MKEDQIKQGIDTRLAGLKFHAVAPEEIKPRLKVVYRRKSLAATIAAVLCLALLTGTAVKIIPLFQQIQAPLSHTQRALPEIQLESESNGIKIEVLEAYYDDFNPLIIEMKLTDQQGNRLSDDDIFKFFSLQAAVGEAVTELNNIGYSLQYDEELGAIRFQVTSSDWSPAVGPRVVLSLATLAQHETSEHIWKTGISLEDILNRKPGVRKLAPEDVYDQEAGELLLKDQGKLLMLEPDEWVVHPEGYDTAYLSNVGLVDHLLHVQLYSPDGYDSQQISPFYFVNSMGEKFPLNEYAVSTGVNRRQAVSFSVVDGGVTQELLYELDEQKLESLRLRNNGELDSLELTGEWRTHAENPVVDGSWKLVVEPEDRTEFGK